MSKPFIFTSPWAYARAETDAPMPPYKQTLIGSGRTSIEMGFPRETMLPIDSGGVPPYCQDFNGIFKAITQNLVWYSAGGLFEYDQSREYEPPAIVSYNGKIYRCVKANSSKNVAKPGNTEYWKHVLDETDVQPIYSDFSGMVSFFATKNAPSNNWLVCDGREISRTVYAGLFKLIGTTYGEGNGSTTFNLPNLVNRVAWGATSEVGSSIEAGLPDIQGQFGRDDREAEVVSGAFEAVTSNKRDTTAEGGDGRSLAFDFKASRYNPIYGNSDTVQPPALKLLPCIHV